MTYVLMSLHPTYSLTHSLLENPQNWERSKSALGTGGVADPKIHAPPHMCYHVKFGGLRQMMYA